MVRLCPYNNCGLPGLHELKLPPRPGAPNGTTMRYCFRHLLGVLVAVGDYEFQVEGRLGPTDGVAP